MLFYHQVVIYFKDLTRWNPRTALATLALMAATAVTDGVALLSLLPLLALAGIGTSRAALPLSLPALTLPQALALFVALIAVRAVLKGSRDRLQDTLRHGFVDQLRLNTFTALTQMRWQAIMAYRGSDLGETLMTDVDQVGLCTFYALRLLSTGGVALAYGLIALRLSWISAALALGVAAGMALLQWRLPGLARRSGLELGRNRRRLAAAASSFLAGIKQAKCSNEEQRLVAEFAAISQQARQRQMQFTHSQSRARGGHEVIGASVLAGLSWAMLDQLHLPTDHVLLMILIMARLLPMLSELQQTLVQIAHTLAAYDHVQHLLEHCRQQGESDIDALPSPPLTQQIRLQQVAFRYGDGPEALTGIDLTVPARRTTAIMGPSGAGKSTLADLLAGLLRPAHGQIRIDDQELTDGMLRHWRSRVAYVPQEVFLKHDTIRANLGEAPDDHLWHALTQAAAAEFVRQLPLGLETVVGERGVRFSGGERQRLALARAFLRRPDVLILDEATSALDDRNEQQIQQALTNIHGQLTVVLIAHRQSTVACADRVITLRQGRIAP